MLTSKDKPETKRLPMMPIRDVVIFPHMMTPFVVGRPSSVRALEEALAADKKIFLATQHDASLDDPSPDQIFEVGTVVSIVQSLKLPDGNIKVLVEGLERARIVSVNTEDGFMRAVGTVPNDYEPPKADSTVGSKLEAGATVYIREKFQEKFAAFDIPPGAALEVKRTANGQVLCKAPNGATPIISRAALQTTPVVAKAEGSAQA